jgi:urease accessory protein
MNAHLLLLADSRLPAGGHAHSGGLEAAAAAGAVTDHAGLADFLHGRLATTGLVTAAIAAAACTHAPTFPRDLAVGVDAKRKITPGGGWGRLDAEADARMPSPAQRQASRAQGRTLLRVARTTWPHPALDALACPAARDDNATASSPAVIMHLVSTRSARSRREVGGPHHPVVLGAATAAAGGTPRQAAAIAAYGSVTGPASAAVRLLGLDPLAVHRTLAGLAPHVDETAAEAAAAAAGAARAGDWAALPALSAPMLDLYAERHLQSEMRLFES